jgi:6-phosphogluconolactonase
MRKILALSILAAGLLLTLADFTWSGGKDPRGTYTFYAGSGSGRQVYSIFFCEFDPSGAAITVLDSFAGATGSGYLDLSPDGSSLYATSTAPVPGDPDHNSVTAFRVSREDHSLQLLNHQSSQGSGPCHLKVSPAGDFLFVANYNSGQAAVLPIAGDGSIKEASDVVRGEGNGPVKGRQEGPHMHQVMTDPSGKYLLVPDLGTDKVMNYVLDHETGTLTPNPEQPFLAMVPGAGPRHLAFHPSGKYVYIVSELNATVTACSFNPETGVLSVINSAGTVEDDFTGKRQSAAARVHPGGRFVYASNRDDESNLAVFSVEADGGLSRIQIVKDIPYWPRDFNLTPDGKYLLVEGERANVVEVFQVDAVTGRLSKTGIRASLPSPTHILFTD